MKKLLITLLFLCMFKIQAQVPVFIYSQPLQLTFLQDTILNNIIDSTISGFGLGCVGIGQPPSSNSVNVGNCGIYFQISTS